MGLFGNVKTSGKVEKTQDFLGGSFAVPSDIYDIMVKVAYMGNAASSKAQSVNLILDVGGKEVRQTVWITNRENENFFHKNGKDIEMPGWTLIDELCLITTGLPLVEQENGEKVVNVYDPEQKKEMPKSVVTLSDLEGKTCSAAILEVKEDKTKKNDSTGKYEPTGETTVKNDIVKFFDTESRKTVVEAREGSEGGVYFDTWLEKNKGNVLDKSTKTSGNTGTAGGPPKASGAGNSGQAPRQSLFGKK